MGEQDKPVQTDPSVPQTSPEDSVRENVANAIKDQQTVENPIAQALNQTGTDQGGTKADVPSPSDSSKTTTNPDEALLSFIEGSTGRKFNTVDDAQKFIKNLNSFVGDQEIAKAREGAKLYDALVKKVAEDKGQSVDEVKKFFTDVLLSGGTQPKPQAQPTAPVAQPQAPRELRDLENKVQTLEDKAQRAELKAKYPFATEVEDEVAIIAQQKGISYVEAFEGSPLKPLLEGKVKEESGKSPVVAPSNRSNFDVNKVQDAAKRVITRGRESDKLDLMRQFKDALGL